MTAVPCNGCRLCCQNDAIVLHPDLGDDPAKYKTVPFVHPLTGEDALMLDHKPNGDCIYLGEKGCENYEARPVICREFDCRKLYLRMTKAQREKLVKANLCDKTKFNAGKQRVHTLSHEEKHEQRLKRDGKI